MPLDSTGSRVSTVFQTDSVGQRERALAVTRSSPPGSVGAAIRPILSAAMFTLDRGAGVATNPINPIMGEQINRLLGIRGREFAAGTVGDFYERNRELLRRPATDENIAEFARRETAFFQREPGLAGFIGGAFSAEGRASLIRRSRDLQRYWEK